MSTEPYALAAQEDRCTSRAQVGIPASLRVSGMRAVPTVVHDLGRAGFCCSAVSRLTPGALCWITLPGLRSLQSRVIWWDASLAGCAFDDLLNPIVLDSLLHRWRHETGLRSPV